MKRTVIISCLAITSLGIKAQNVFPTSGNVGIGTTSPKTELEVNGGIDITGTNSTPSVNGFRNALQLTSPSHAAIVYKSGQKGELMFGFHSNGNYYWGTGKSATKPNYYSMFLNGSNGNLTVNGVLSAKGFKSASITGPNPTPSVNGFQNRIEFVGGPHGAMVFHPGQKDELMFGLHSNGNFYWGTGRSATKPDYYSMTLNGSNGNLNVKGINKAKAMSVNGANPTPSVNGFLNRLEFVDGPHGAMVFHPGQKDELMFGLHSNGNFYWGTGQSADKPNYYSMYLNGSNGNLTINGTLSAKGIKAASINGANPTASVHGFQNRIEFVGGPHGAMVFHPGQKDELMFGLHSNGNFYWGTGQSADKPNYYSMYLNGSNGNLTINGTLSAKGIKAASINGANPTASVYGFQNRIEFVGGPHGAMVFHPGQKDELMFGLHSNGNFYWGTGQSADKPNYYSMYLNGSNGNLGIRGKLTANEVEVKLGGWADFVFEDSYDLKSLEDVESFINENKHLPDVPTESEVKENGLSLGQSNAMLLQKIEELTLYLIQQNKEIKTLKDQNKKIVELEEKIKKLEAGK